MPFKPNSFFKFNVNHYDFFINLRDLHKIFYTLEPEPLYTVFFKDREANYVNELNPKRLSKKLRLLQPLIKFLIKIPIFPIRRQIKLCQHMHTDRSGS